MLSQARLQRQASRYKREMLQRLLTSYHCSQRPPYLSEVFHKDEIAARTRFKKANLVGIGFGANETQGKLIGDLAVRVYVTQKLPKQQLPRQYRIPDAVNGIVTDIIPVGQLQLHSRPAALAASISHIHGGAGSLGCVVSRQGD